MWNLISTLAALRFRRCKKLRCFVFTCLYTPRHINHNPNINCSSTAVHACSTKFTMVVNNRELCYSFLILNRNKINQFSGFYKIFVGSWLFSHLCIGAFFWFSAKGIKWTIYRTEYVKFYLTLFLKLQL